MKAGSSGNKKGKVEVPVPFKTLNIEDIISLSDKKVKELIKNLDIETVTYAMKDVDKNVRQKVEKNLGKRALRAYREILKGINELGHSEISKSKKLFERQIKSLIK
ncbi:MAG: FliG C-terminal domain-containing protein [Bacteroidota bacterium]|nr:FliG C-terminal domain-containing protein [Bacteroidota bacterium]